MVRIWRRHDDTAAQRQSSSSDGARQWRRLRLGFCEGEATAAGLARLGGVSGSFYRGNLAPGRAGPRGTRRGAGSDSGSSASPVRTRGRGRPRRADPTGQRERGIMGVGLGCGSWAARGDSARGRKKKKKERLGRFGLRGKEEKERERLGWAGEREEERFSIYF